MSPQTPFPPGCAELFAYVRHLGEGASGTVYLAQQIGLNRPVAIKLLSAHAFTEPHQQRRFLQEARVTATLDDRHIVVLLDHGVDASVPWIAYEYLSGRTVRKLLDAGPVPIALALTIASQVAKALRTAHGNGVIHRDIKPENVLEAGADWFKVADFGLAKLLGGDSIRTEAGILMGTPQYIAPELVGGDACTPQSDLYALGAMLFELLTGSPPFPAEDLSDALRAHLERPVPSPRFARDGVPGRLDELVVSLLAKTPADRPPDAQHVVEELAQVECTLGTDTAKTFHVQHLRSRPRSNLRWLAGGLAAGLVALGGSLLFFPDRPQAVNSQPPVRVTPAPPPASTLTTCWRSYEQTYWRRLCGKGGEAAAADLEVADGLPPLRGAKEWKHWIELGRWLDAPTGDPPRYRDARAVPWDNFETKMAASALRHGHESATALYARALKTAGNFPEDPRTWLLMGAVLFADEQRALASRAYLHAGRLLSRHLFPDLWILPELLLPFKKWSLSSSDPGSAAMTWTAYFMCQNVRDLFGSFTDHELQVLVRQAIADPLLSECQVERIGDLLFTRLRGDLAAAIFRKGMRDRPAHEGAAARLLGLSLMQGRIEDCAPIVELLRPKAGASVGSCVRTTVDSALLRRAEYLVEVERDPSRSPAVFQSHREKLLLSAYEVERLLANHDLPGAEQIAGRVLASGGPADMVAIYVVGGGSNLAAARERVKSSLVVPELPVHLWENLAGIRSGPALAWVDELFRTADLAAAELDRKRNARDAGVVPVAVCLRLMRALWLSRRGMGMQAMEALEDAQNAVRQPLDAEIVCEILVRPLCEGRPPAELRQRIARNMGPLGNGGTIALFKALLDGRWAVAVKIANLAQPANQHRALWHLVWLWDARRRRNRADWDRFARAARTSFRFQLHNGWLLRWIQDSNW